MWASFVWNMFDFGAAHRTEGDRPGINDKGLVTHDRKIKKLSLIHIYGVTGSSPVRTASLFPIYQNYWCVSSVG